MSESAEGPIGVDARRLAQEIIATLVYIKGTAADRLLRPAGVPDDLVKLFLKGRDSTTGEPFTKRQSAALILDELSQRDAADTTVIRKLIEIASTWDSFELAQEEFKARAVVQKARALQGSLTEADVREAEQLARAQAEQARARQKARQNALARESSLLLAQFDDLSQSGDPQKRGYALQDILTRLFNVHGVAVKRSFMRNQGAEQIDGAFELEGWHYIVECRWRERMADIRQLDGLLGQLGRSGRQTMGLFLSINGWSEHVVDLLKQNNDKSIILMEGYDLRTVLSQTVDLRRLLKEKLSALNLRAEPYLSARDVIVVE